MDMELKDKVVLITGGSQGIGEGITRSFAAEGAIAVMVVRKPESAAALAEELSALGQRADYVYAELTDDDCIQKAVAEILAEYGRIDVVVNNAGVNDAVGLRSTPEAFTASLRKNLVHYFSVVHHTLDALIESKGSIVNIGSKIADTGQGGTSGYAASNGGINALTREWAVDLSKYGIRVNCVSPAEVITPLYEKWLANTPDPEGALRKLNETIPYGNRTTTVEEIADTVVFVASARSSHTTGQILHPDGGYVHLDRACTMDTSHLQTTR
jgi:L-fucose dehydrogenase